MSDKLKEFVREHRQQFDTSEPSKDLWQKIDSRMEAKTSSRISSKWLSKFKYLALSASVLLVAIYFIANNLNDASASELSANREATASPNSDLTVNADQNKPELNEVENIVNVEKDTSHIINEPNKPTVASSNKIEPRKRSTKDSSLAAKKDPFLNTGSSEPNNSEQEKTPKGIEETKANSAIEKKETGLVKNAKKAKIYIPQEPEEMNDYIGVLYEGPSFRAMLLAYKFPGKFALNGGGLSTIKTISCSKLEKISNIKAVWLKGRTDKEILVSIKKGFKNIVLVKSDGRKLKPEAISHYYRGLGVISEYRGRYFNLLYKDKVELILFFKDVEAGDKIVIDGNIRATVKNQP